LSTVAPCKSAVDDAGASMSQAQPPAEESRAVTSVLHDSQSTAPVVTRLKGGPQRRRDASESRRHLSLEIVTGQRRTVDGAAPIDEVFGPAHNTRLRAPGAPLLRRPVAQPAREPGCRARSRVALRAGSEAAKRYTPCRAC